MMEDYNKIYKFVSIVSIIINIFLGVKLYKIQQNLYDSQQEIYARQQIEKNHLLIDEINKIGTGRVNWARSYVSRLRRGRSKNEIINAWNKYINWAEQWDNIIDTTYSHLHEYFPKSNLKNEYKKVLVQLFDELNKNMNHIRDQCRHASSINEWVDSNAETLNDVETKIKTIKQKLNDFVQMGYKQK